MSITVILVIVLLILAGYVWMTYNALAGGLVRIKEALSGIDVQLKRRIDLIPNLVESVKGYAKHEKDVFENVTKARSALVGANSVEEKGQANNMLTGALKSLFAVAEAYPNLRANENFKHLQEELSDTENKIAYSRQFYNGNVRDFNTTLVTFPGNMIGNMFGFKQQEFFEAEESERKSVKVSF